MTDDEIIRLYHQANRWDVTGLSNTIADLRRFAKLVIAAERELNAVMVEHKGMEGYGTLAIAAMIRKGGE